ncbi:MAG: DNA-directed RNA polymerase subunit omega [Candidatus Omnitrophica bacterium]|nr:DNA-directed RNA polymerase subunit omega [Candidatus Omnitrophota bacterium]MCM8798335.1 DNA-directed RNA polymerase subunit omega [Candidatus Omnitrophota bacterium]
MAYIPLEKVLKNVGSIYKAVNLASKRAIELNEGAPKLVNVNSAKLSTIALEEIMQGKIKYKKVKKEEK